VNYYKHHIGDYAKKTGHLSLLEHGAYLLMLQSYYATERPLPEGKVLYRLVRAESKLERAAVDKVVREFWEATPEGLINARADLEIATDRAFIDHQRSAALARWGKNGNGHAGAHAGAHAEGMPLRHQSGINPASNGHIPSNPIPTPTPIRNPLSNPTPPARSSSSRARGEKSAEKGEKPAEKGRGGGFLEGVGDGKTAEKTDAGQ
jgi:uncharacterized protein YdaU (DUF1376 family)